MRTLALFAVVCALASCGVKEDVTLSASVRNANLAKGVNSFGPKVEGGVDVYFDLGAYSGAPVSVEQIQIGVYKGSTQVLDTLHFVPPLGTSFPLTLSPGERKTLHYDVPAVQLKDADVPVLCGGGLTISGTATQTGNPPIQIVSVAVNVTGC